MLSSYLDAFSHAGILYFKSLVFLWHLLNAEESAQAVSAPRSLCSPPPQMGFSWEVSFPGSSKLVCAHLDLWTCHGVLYLIAYVSSSKLWDA